MNLDSAVFYSNNIDTVEKFYRDIVGLEVEYRQGDKFISFLFGNGVRLGIKKAVESREVVGSQTIFISCSDINAEYEKYKNLNLGFHKHLTNESWGREFAIYDPDKNKVEFLQRT